MYVRENALKKKVANGETVVGIEVWLRDPKIIELMGQTGFDFAHIEYEHVAHNWENVENLIRTSEAAGLTPLFRSEQCFDGQPPVNQIIKALKCGAQIIMVPQVGNAETAKKIVAAAKYPPLGRRGIASCDRSAVEIIPEEEEQLDIKRFISESNNEVMLWAIIETPEGVENIDEILEVEGIDAVGFGHQDYAIAAGLAYDSGDEVEKAREKVQKAAAKKGKYMWWNTDQSEVVDQKKSEGIQIFLFSVDIIQINKMYRDIVSTVKPKK